jgi:translation initiation factor 3 subunit A
MKKYLELCVDLRRGQEAKAAIHQYRTLCGTQNIRSLDDVLLFFLDLAEKRAQKAQAESKNVSLDLERDLDSEIPESVLMSEISGEDIKDRTDREIVTPWLKFLWETYRHVLDVLKNNAMLEARYHDAAQRAFKFCKQYKRKREFKGLSELLRTHLSNIQRYATSATTTPYHKITLSSAETLQHYIDTRFKQLSTASYLELWQEAYRSVEDLHRLLALSKELPKPQLLINYYDHLTKIFWNSQNYVLHSYAYYKLFNLLQAHQASGSKESKRTEKAEKGEEATEPLDFKTIASSLLLSSISIPSTRTTHDEDIIDMDFGDIEKQQRLANLLDLSSLPDKNLLLSQVVTKRVTSLVHPELKDLYRILEVELNPLEICERMEKIFSFLQTNPKLKVYIQPLKDVTLAKLIGQLSRVYQSIRLSQVVQMVSFMTLPEIERGFVQAVRQRRILMTIDHQNDCITFGNNRNTSSLDTDSVRTQLAILAKRLYLAQALVNPPVVTAVTPKGPVLLQTAASKDVIEEEHQNLVNRKDLIEKKKLWEAENKKRELELQKKLEEEERKKREIEEQKLAEKEAKEREIAAQKRAEDEARKIQHQQIIENLTSTVVAPQVVKNVMVAASADIKDVEKLVDEKQKKILSEKKEREKRLLQKVNNLDVLERARRTEEIPLIKEYYETQKKTDRERYESQHKALQEQQRQKFEHDKKMKQQLSKMFKDRREFVNSFVLETRKAQIDSLKREYEEKKKRAKQAWEEKRDKIQKEIARIQKDKEEEEAKKQEALKKKRDEEERKRKEEETERQNRDKEEQDRRKRLDDLAEKRMQKEREIEKQEAEKKKKLEEQRQEEQRKKELERQELLKKREQERSQKEKDTQPSGKAPPKSSRWDIDDNKSSSFGRGKPMVSEPKREDPWRRGPSEPSTVGRGSRVDERPFERPPSSSGRGTGEMREGGRNEQPRSRMDEKPSEWREVGRNQEQPRRDERPSERPPSSSGRGTGELHEGGRNEQPRRGGFNSFGSGRGRGDGERKEEPKKTGGRWKD